jgi:hypothetical protein
MPASQDFRNSGPAFAVQGLACCVSPLHHLDVTEPNQDRLTLPTRKELARIALLSALGGAALAIAGVALLTRL